MSNAIKPTVGRVVWYWPKTSDGLVGGGDQPLSAIVAHVWTDSCINLAVFDANGVAHNRTSVLLVQDGEPKPSAGFAEWMPYQKGQAAKTEAVEKALADVGTHAPKPKGGDVVDAEWFAPGAAPRVTMADIELNIAGEHYFTALEGAYAASLRAPVERVLPVAAMDPLGLLTFCVLVLRNGFTVTGESACVSPENFDAEIGRRVARENAVAKVWPLLGYALKERLAAAFESRQA